MSPFSITAKVPFGSLSFPSAASGLICPIHGPRVPPEKRPSVNKATESDKPIPTIAAVGASISRIPGPPFGPS